MLNVIASLLMKFQLHYEIVNPIYTSLARSVYLQPLKFIFFRASGCYKRAISATHNALSQLRRVVPELELGHEIHERPGAC